MHVVTRTMPRGSRAAAETCRPRSSPLQPGATRPYLPVLKALGDETRLEIVGLLAAERKELCVCDIESHFEIGQPTVSHHLRILREAGVVTAERRGTWVYYSLERGALRKLSTLQSLLGG